MEKEKKSGKVDRRDFIKKMAYAAPVIATLVIPKYTAAQPPCPSVCTAVCVDQCTPRCPGRCVDLCPPRCAGRCSGQ